MNKILYYTGKVVDGRKNASSLIKDNYVHLTSTLGFWHFPWTLNIVFNTPVLFNQKQAIYFDEGKKLFWNASYLDKNIPIYIYRWRGAPLHVLEFISSVKLRKYFNLNNKSQFTISINRSMVLPIGWINKFIWYVIWKNRPSWYYRNEFYKKFVYASKINYFASQYETIAIHDWLYKKLFRKPYGR